MSTAEPKLTRPQQVAVITILSAVCWAILFLLALGCYAAWQAVAG